MANVSTSEAELVLKLYDLRREEVMRKARNFIVGDFWPKSADDVLAVANAWGSEQNAYFRQVISFWEMAASLPLRGGGECRFICRLVGRDVLCIREDEPYPSTNT